MRKFYNSVTYSQINQENIFGLFLDGKPLKTPANNLVLLPTLNLAKIIAEEWKSQNENILPETMPLTQVVYTAIDQVSCNRKHYENEVLRYAKTDTICYRVDQPIELAKMQEDMWSPLLLWSEKQFGIILSTTTNAMAIEQPRESLILVKQIISNYNHWNLSGLIAPVRASGSFIIGLAVSEKFLCAEEAFKFSELERTWQIGRWGEDSESSIIREKIRKEFIVAEMYFKAISV